MTHAKSALFFQLSELRAGRKMRDEKRQKGSLKGSCKKGEKKPTKNEHTCLQTKANAKIMQEVYKNCTHQHL